MIIMDSSLRTQFIIPSLSKLLKQMVKIVENFS